MSNEAITWAYRQPITTGAKFVLVALADLADEAHSCYPGQAKLATMTGQGERTVRRQLLELELANYLTRSRRFDAAGHRTSDRYVLPVGQEIPTGQTDRRPERPVANTASGQNGQRPTTTALPAIYDSPTGQNGQVSLREPTKEPSGTTSQRPEIAELCQRLADRIEANGSKRPRVTEAWRTSCRLMIDADGRDPMKIAAAIDWCQQDEFWRVNILSMRKLREKYDQLRLAAQRGRPNGPGKSEDHIARAARRLGVTA